MTSQASYQKKDSQKTQILNILVQKQELIKQLVDRCNRQQKRLTTLLYEQKNTITTSIQFDLYKKYIFEPENENEKVSFVCFKLKSDAVQNQQPIVISNNLQLQLFKNQTSFASTNILKTNKDIGIQTCSEDNQFRNVLQKNVDDLKHNIQKCQTLISNLKELKQIDQVQDEKRSEFKSQSLLLISSKQKTVVTQKQQSQWKSLQKGFTKCLKENEEMRKKVKEFEKSQKYYLSVIEDLQIQRIKYQQGSPAKELKQIKKEVTPEVTPNKPKKKQGKVYLVNY